ncbi:MAG: cell division protein FtsZ [Candidatus Glassbacteria bacterium RIFCSPLOWO2_12_FULL_58_11]|uniref:Cell division protein FtsZ n=1 Tax=Candidatus Glassbacteria bacterium RIFCSPLOWO2_12_FULL_58_11 TaxID=1817867 RepID=A0A1F5YJZ9_9BACT|nr:MAG: cell division protein FtsZ [Candidatus Glassbacteria bacterium RIFCSPLOWO2_12_FULL_58_11]
MATFEFTDAQEQMARITVIGVGGAGGNAINHMIISDMKGVDFIACNTDVQALSINKAQYKVQIGKELTKGLGAGARPEVGRQAIEESREEVSQMLDGSDMVFITAGMGGGTGTGAAPVVAEIARELGALTIGVVTRPFIFEGRKRIKQADSGIIELRKYVDTIIIVPNQRLLGLVGKSTTFPEALQIADNILFYACQGISELITTPALVNLDFADVKTIMANMGDALMGTGFASGEYRASEAAQEAISSPLLEDVQIKGAKGVLVNITGGSDLTLHEVNDANNIIYEAAGEEANIIFGAAIDESMNGQVRVTVIATGFGEKREQVQINKNLLEARSDNVLEISRVINDDLSVSSQVTHNSIRTGTDRNDIVKSGTVPIKTGPYPLTIEELEIPTFIRRQVD